MGILTHHNKPIERHFTKMSTKGGPLRLMYRTGYPKYDPVQSSAEDDTNVTRKRGKSSMKSVLIAPAALKCVERLENYDINRMENDPDMQVSFVKTCADGLNMGSLDTINEQLFPYSADQLNITGNGGVIPGTVKGRVANITRFLGTGYDGNEATGSGSYNIYKDIDFNALDSKMKAVNVGSDGSSYTLSPKKIFTDVISKLKARKAGHIVVLCDVEVYGYFWDNLQAKAAPDTKEFMEFGGEYFGYSKNVTFVYEPMLDLLPANSGKREMLFLDVTEWFFQYEDLEAKGGGITVVTDVPYEPEITLLQDYLEFQYGCRDISKQGHAYNVVIP